MAVLTTAGDPAHWSRKVLDHAIADTLWRVHEEPGPAPWLDPAKLAEQRRRLPESLYARLFENVWTSGEDRLVSAEDLAACVMLGRLEDARIEELAGLVGKAGTDRGGWDREALGRRETKLLEALVEQAAGLDRGHYEAERKAETDRFAALAAEARRMPRLSREAETDFFQTMFRMLNVGHLWPNHVSLLLLVIAMLRAGEGLAESGCRVEGSGADARLVVNFARGLGLRGNGLPNWRWHLEWLAKNNWLTLEEGRVTWHIGLGPRTLKMLRERS